MKCFLLISLMFVLSCKEQDLNMKIPYSGDKLVLSGVLKAGLPVKIQVTKTFNPVGDIPAEVTISNAKVVLFKDGIEFVTLLPLEKEKGIYVSDSLVEPGVVYIVKASAQKFPTAESAAVLIPTNVPDITAVRARNVPGQINQDSPQDLVSLYFTKEDAVGDSYFSIKLTCYYPNDTLSAYPYSAADNIPGNEEDCHTWMEEAENPRFNSTLNRIVYPTSRVFLMRNRCLSSPQLPLKFYAQSGSGPNSSIPAEVIVVRIGVITKEAFDYAKIEYDQPEGLDLLVLPPQRAITNIKNGYGLISASNEKTIKLP